MLSLVPRSTRWTGFAGWEHAVDRLRRRRFPARPRSYAITSTHGPSTPGATTGGELSPTWSSALTAAVELVADTVEAVEPRTMRKRLLAGLVDDLGMQAAVLWTQLERGSGLALLDEVGVSPELAGRLAAWPSGSTPDRVARSDPRSWDRQVLTHGPIAGTDLILHLVALPEPATELLGVLTHDRLADDVTRLLAAVGRAYSTALRQAAVIRDSQRIIDAMVGELRPGDVVLPEGYEVGHLYRSATANVDIGGDLFDWFRTDRNQLGVAVGDVSGKGMQAASRTAMAVHSLRAFALGGASPHVVAKMLNVVVEGQTAIDSFVTLAYVRIEPDTGDAEFVLAGHPPPIVLRADATEVIAAPADLPLGVDTAASFELHHTRLRRGDSLVLYTDGVTEARAAEAHGALLGTAGLVSLLDDLRGRSPQEMADGVWDGVQRYTGGDTSDDCAVLVLRRS